MVDEWMPPGWTVEIKVRNSGKKDWFYFDPSRERKFKSKPEVLRYLKTLETISDPQEKRRSRRNRSKLDSPAVAEQAQLADSGINGQNTKRQGSKPTGPLKIEKTLESSAGEETSALDSKDVNKSTNGESNPASVPESPSQNKSVPKVEISGNNRLQIGNDNKSHNKHKKVEFPRRASKRLAGVEAGPIPELTSSCKSRRISYRKVDDTESATARNSLDHTNMTTNEENTTHDYPSESSATPNAHSINKCDGVENVPINKSDDMAGVSPQVPMQDLWNDPCIEFAIKTLTGQIPIEEELGKDKAFVEGWEPCKELNLGDLWADPCIQFAVKTLTGDIPNDSSSQNYFQKRDKGLDFSLGLGSVSKMDGFPQIENSSLLNVADGGVRQRCEERDGREDPKRPTVRL